MNPRLAQIMAAAAMAFVLTGCGTLSSEGDAAKCQEASYDGKKGTLEPYVDRAHGFRICVPQGLTRNGPTGFDDGRVVFSGFAVPAGANLEAKTLVIVPGKYDDVTGATAFGHLTAGGVEFVRTRLDEGSMGHSTLHIIYTWTIGAKIVHFDFTHRAVNPGVFDPGKQPKLYNQAAQIKLSEEIMGTVVQLK